jgi:hypothetical protein
MASSERPWQGAGVGHQALPDDEIADDDQDGAEGDVSENEQQVPEQSSPIIHYQPSGTILRGAPARTHGVAARFPGASVSRGDLP